MKHLLLIVMLFSAVSASAQVVIYGSVRAMGTAEGVADANIMLQDVEGKALYDYCISDSDGNYSLEYSGTEKALRVVVTGFNLKPQSREIEVGAQRIDFEVEYSDLEIKEVVVRAASVERNSDTITYNVATFINASDRSIGDVLRKMPGLTIGEAGEIKYNGKAISKLYIEGLDMLNGRYGIATNNIQAKDIARVEVLENHEPIKALKGITIRDQAALNLRLKESAKGTWNGTAELGGGYKPWMWSGELSAMYFSKRFQTISIYKTNNMGNDVSREFISHYGAYGGIATMLGVHKPTPPNITQSRYLDNNIHAVSVNAITKLNEDMELSLNTNYIHDMQHAQGGGVTTYYIPNGAPLTITETTSASHIVDKCDLMLNLHSNTEARYLEEALSFGGAWNRDSGNVDSNGEMVSQYFKLPQISLSNNFYNVRRWDRWVVHFMSDIDYDTQPAQLEIRPMLYDSVLANSQERPNAMQTLYGKRLIATNSLQTGYKLKHLQLSLSAQLNADVENMESSLNAVSDNGDIAATTAELQNNTLYSRLDFVVTPSVQYALGSKFVAQADLSLDLMWLYMADRTRAITPSNKLKLLYLPTISISSSPTPNLKLTARASYWEHYGNINDYYAGYIMTDYRVIQRKAGAMSNLRSQTYGVQLSYGNAIDAIFSGVEANYSINHSNLMYNTSFTGALSEIEAIKRPSRSDSYNIKANISKRFNAIATTATLSGEYMRSWSEILRESTLVPSTYQLITAKLNLNTRITKAVRVDYSSQYNRSISAIGDQAHSAIDLLKQSANVDFIIAESVICRVGAEHFLNSAISSKSRNTIFIDASIRVKHKRMEYAIEAHNILNNTSFANASNSNSLSHIYTYSLRPASVVFRVKFSLK